MLYKPSVTVIGLLATATLLTTAVWALAFILPSVPEPSPLVIDPQTQIVLNGDREATIELTGSGLDRSLQVWLAPEVSGRQDIVSSLHTHGRPQQIVIRNKLAYIANGPSGVMIVDISNRRSPTVLGSIIVPGTAIQLDVQEKLALVAAGASGLQILDINNTSAPLHLSTLSTVTPALAVVSQEHLAFVACGKNGVQVVDLSDAITPRKVGELDLPGPALNLARHNNTLIVTLGEHHGVSILDISVPARPRQLAQLRLNGFAGNSVAVNGDHAVVAVFNSAKEARGNRLYAIDLTAPSQPRITSVLPLDGRPFNLSWLEHRVTVALGANGLRNYDLSDPMNPRLESSFCPPGSVFSATLDDDTAWVADTRGILSGIDLSSTAQPVQSATIPIATPTAPTLGRDSRLYLADKNHGLTIYDVTDQTRPVLLGALPVSGTIRAMALQRELIFLGIENDDRSTGVLQIVDITAPSNPQVLSSLSFFQIPLPIDLVDNTLVLAKELPSTIGINRGKAWRNTSTLSFVDVSVPRKPRVTSEYPLNTATTSVALDDNNHLCLISPEGVIQVIDIQKPYHPVLLGQLETPWIEQSEWRYQLSTILFYNKLALVPTMAGNIRLINLEDPQHPTDIGTITTGGMIVSMSMSDNLLILSVKQKGVMLIDLQTPQPQFIGVLPLPGLAQRVAVSNGRLWYSFENGSGVFSAQLPLRLNVKTVNNKKRIQLKIPTGDLAEGDYSLWLSTRENRIEQPALIRYRKG